QRLHIGAQELAAVVNEFFKDRLNITERIDYRGLIGEEHAGLVTLADRRLERQYAAAVQTLELAAMLFAQTPASFVLRQRTLIRIQVKVPAPQNNLGHADFAGQRRMPLYRIRMQRHETGHGLVYMRRSRRCHESQQPW